VLYILTGQDDFSLERALQDVRKELGDAATLAMSTSTLEGKSVTPSELASICTSMPFMSPKRLVIVEGLLGRFESQQGGPRRSRKTPAAPTKAPEYEPFVDVISKTPDFTVLVLVDGVLRSSNPLFKALSPKARVQTFPPLANRELQIWVEERVTYQGGSITTGAVGQLSRLVGSNLRVMASEIDKLVAYAADRKINEQDVSVLVGYSQESNVFNMVDAVLESRAEAAGKSLKQLLDAGAAPSYLLTMLARQVQLVVRAHELREQGMTRAEMQSRLGISHDFVMRKTLEQASRHTMPRLRNVYEQLLEADISIKTGRFDPDLALSMLVAELCR
jgi:DNA polymerase III subunit delta